VSLDAAERVRGLIADTPLTAFEADWQKLARGKASGQ
jgi:hypothetical protein